MNALETDHSDPVISEFSSSRALDNIIIVDTFPERGREIANLVEGYASQVELININSGIDEAREYFGTVINELLASKKAVMVIFNIVAGVSGGIISCLRAAEEKHEKGTRRILVTCKCGTTIRSGFKERGLDRSGIRYIKYDDTGFYLEEIERLFKPTLYTAPKYSVQRTNLSAA